MFECSRKKEPLHTLALAIDFSKGAGALALCRSPTGLAGGFYGTVSCWIFGSTKFRGFYHAQIFSETKLHRGHAGSRSNFAKLISVIGGKRTLGDSWRSVCLVCRMLLEPIGPVTGFSFRTCPKWGETR